MDWITFLKDNSQSLFTLAGVFLGSVITFLISYLNNRFQAKERDKDRAEQRREAKVQLALELTRKDIEIVDKAIAAESEWVKDLDINCFKNECYENIQKRHSQRVADYAV